MTEPSIQHLSQLDLANRWRISHRTLERWRWSGEGPRFVKLGGRVVYRLTDIEAYEAAQLRGSTADVAAWPTQRSGQPYRGSTALREADR